MQTQPSNNRVDGGFKTITGLGPNMAKATTRKEPSLAEWSALSGLVMRYELLSEELAQDRSLSEAERAKTFGLRLGRLAREPAYRWLIEQPGYVAAMQAFTRWIGDTPFQKFDFLATVCLCIEKFHANHGELEISAGASTRLAAVECAKQLTHFVAEAGAGHENQADDYALLGLLDRYVADNVRLARPRRIRARDAVRHHAYVTDVARLLITLFNAAPPSVIKPLVGLVDCKVEDRELGKLLAQAKRETQALAASHAEAGGEVLERILITPTRTSRGSAHKRQKA